MWFEARLQTWVLSFPPSAEHHHLCFVSAAPTERTNKTDSDYLLTMADNDQQQWLDNPRYVRHAAAAADLFCARFSPEAATSEANAEGRANEIRASIKRDVEHEMVQVRSRAACVLLFYPAGCVRRRS